MKVLAFVLLISGFACLAAGQDDDFEPFMLGGVELTSDVYETSRMDRDYEDIAFQLKSLDFKEAREFFRKGDNSDLPNGDLRSFLQFANGLPRKQKGEPLYQMHRKYWKNYGVGPRFAGDLIDFAFDKKHLFKKSSDEERARVIEKSVLFYLTYMAVSHSYRKSVKKCRARKIPGMFGAIWNADEAWALYTGSREGPVGARSGHLQYHLADLRCGEFQTCESASFRSKVNVKMINLQSSFKRNIRARKCGPSERILEQMERLMLIPLIQSLIGYAYSADPKVLPGRNENQALGWAFLQPLLPQFYKCNRFKAKKLREGLLPRKKPIPDGHEKYIKMMQSMYSCLGVTCDEIGSYAPFGYVVLPKCRDP